MSQETAKYILWILLCLPMVVLGMYFFRRLVKDINDINRVKRARRKRAAEEKRRREEEQRRREFFGEDYDEYGQGGYPPGDSYPRR